MWDHYRYRIWRVHVHVLCICLDRGNKAWIHYKHQSRWMFIVHTAAHTLACTSRGREGDKLTLLWYSCQWGIFWNSKKIHHGGGKFHLQSVTVLRLKMDHKEEVEGVGRERRRSRRKEGRGYRWREGKNCTTLILTFTDAYVVLETSTRLHRKDGTLIKHLACPCLFHNSMEWGKGILNLSCLTMIKLQGISNSPLWKFCFPQDHRWRNSCSNTHWQGCNPCHQGHSNGMIRITIHSDIDTFFGKHFDSVLMGCNMNTMRIQCQTKYLLANRHSNVAVLVWSEGFFFDFLRVACSSVGMSPPRATISWRQCGSAGSGKPYQCIDQFLQPSSQTVPSGVLELLSWTVKWFQLWQ